MEKLINLIKAIKDLKWYTLIILFVGVILYLFNHEIVRLIEIEVIKKDIVVSSLENDIAITDALDDLLEKTDSDRAYIFRFHNGVQYYNGTHKSKMSCDYEVVRVGVQREAERLQDIPTGLYSRWIRDVIRGKMFITDVSKMTDLRAKYTLQQQGIEALAVTPYYRDGKVFALIGIDYIRKQPKEKIKKFDLNIEEQKSQFRTLTDDIGDLLI